MRILGVSVLGLIELAACWQEREEARHLANGKTAAPLEDRPCLRAEPRVVLDEGREYVAPANELRQERG